MPDPGFKAVIDQAVEEVREQARVVVAYHAGLKAGGLDDYDALRLTMAFQQGFVFGDRTRPGEEPETQDPDAT